MAPLCSTDLDVPISPMVGLGSYTDMLGGQRATDGTHGDPPGALGTLERFRAMLRCSKPGSLAHEVYWHFRNRSPEILEKPWAIGGSRDEVDERADTRPNQSDK